MIVIRGLFAYGHMLHDLWRYATVHRDRSAVRLKLTERVSKGRLSPQPQGRWGGVISIMVAQGDTRNYNRSFNHSGVSKKGPDCRVWRPFGQTVTWSMET